MFLLKLKKATKINHLRSLRHKLRIEVMNCTNSKEIYRINLQIESLTKRIDYIEGNNISRFFGNQMN